MKIKGDWIIFSTGREAYANGGIIGIDPNGAITGGWDDSIWSTDIYDGEDIILNAQERIELGEYMIQEWKKFIETAKKDLPSL